MITITLIILCIIVIIFAYELIFKTDYDSCAKKGIYTCVIIIATLLIGIGIMVDMFFNLKEDETYKIIAIAECKTDNFCLILNSQGTDNVKFYIPEKKNIGSELRAGDEITLRDDKLLKIEDKENPPSE